MPAAKKTTARKRTPFAVAKLEPAKIGEQALYLGRGEKLTLRIASATGIEIIRES